MNTLIQFEITATTSFCTSSLLHLPVCCSQSCQPCRSACLSPECAKRSWLHPRWPGYCAHLTGKRHADVSHCSRKTILDYRTTSTVRRFSKRPWKPISDLQRKDELEHCRGRFQIHKSQSGNTSYLFGAMVLSVPWYSSGLFLLAPKILIVGKPLTPYWPPSDLCWSASTAPILTIPCRISDTTGWSVHSQL